MRNYNNSFSVQQRRERRKAAAMQKRLDETNRFPMRSRCVTDRASAFTMAVHNIGAGGVNVFCSTNENMYSIKRNAQRNARCMRAIGYKF